MHKILLSCSPYNQINHCCSLKVNHFVPRKEIPSQYYGEEIRESVAATETVNLLISEWPHWPVTENMAVFQVVVLHVNPSDGKIGKQAKIHCESSHFQECDCLKNHLPPPAFLCYGTFASALTQHNKASGSDIPLNEPIHATEVIQHSTCSHM